MLLFSFLLAGSLAWGADTTQFASQKLTQYQFKDALISWKELYEKHPQSLQYALKVGELQLLLEGRTSAFETLRSFLKKQSASLTSPQKQELNKKLVEWSETFLVEEAQINYLQALSKAELKAWEDGLAPITQAIALEPGNTKILALKAEIEKQLGSFSLYLNTLNSLQKALPESDKINEKIAEALIFQGQYAEVEKLFSRKRTEPLSLRSRIALAVSMWEMGKKADAEKTITELNRIKKLGQSFSPALKWISLRLDLESSPDSKETKEELKAFLKLAKQPDQLKIDGWDPYRLEEHAKELSK